MTESGPGVFDALIGLEGDPLQLKSDDFTVIDAGPYCRGLFSLALGRESVFFSWHQDSRSFKPLLEKARIPGASGPILQGVIQKCIHCGNAFRNIQAFVGETYAKSPTPCRTALASALDKTSLAVQSSIARSGRQPCSLLQLDAVVSRISVVMLEMESLASKVQPLRLDEDVLRLVFERAQSAEDGGSHVRHVLREILQQTTRPWFGFLEEWIGTRPELGLPLRIDDEGRRKGFVVVQAETHADDLGEVVKQLDFHLDKTRVPAFLPDDVLQPLFETGRNLRFIRSTHPEHLLARAPSDLGDPPTAQWQFDWDGIRELERRVQSHAEALADAIRAHRRGEATVRDVSMPHWGQSGRYDLRLFGTDEKVLQERLLESMSDLALARPTATPGDKLAEAIDRCVKGDRVEMEESGLEFTPHWSLLPVLSVGSLVKAQARVVGRESLRLLFDSHQLRKHLLLQREFQLCRNGMFCSRLSHALFDPDLETAERQAGVARRGGVMGLRLSGRDTWPPASSELRLALMGVLVDSYADPEKGGGARGKSGESDGLPGDLSFSVRDLASEEIEKCLDPNSLEALDFLRLTYKAPPALQSIITPVTLAHYDRIFRSLLRVLRMLYTVNQLFRDVTTRESGALDADDASVRLCFEARHFIYSLSSYFFDVGIELPWQDFERKLGAVERELLSDPAGTDSSVSDLSPDRLREYHSSVLERIMSALLLRKRQQPVLKLLEDIFRVILRYAKHSRLASAGMSTDEQISSSKLYKAFRRHMVIFLTVCRGMSEKTSSRAGGVMEHSPISQLLSKLDMFDYYLKA